MIYAKIFLLFIVPLICYIIIIKYLEEEYDLELSKFMKAIIFLTIDMLILLIFK